MTRSVWALATVVLASTACSSSDSGTDSTGTDAAPATATPSTSSGSAGSGTSAATGGRGAGTASGGSPGAAVSTGSSGTAGVGAGSAGKSAAAGGSKAAAGASAGASAGSAGTAAPDDSDAGVDDTAAEPAAGSGGSGAAGATAAAGSGGQGAAGAGAAGAAGVGAAGAGAAGAGSEGGTTLDVPADTALTGPWPVGIRTVSLNLGAGVTPVEVFYPAQPGSAAERQKVSYDLTAWLPAEHGIPAEAPKVHIDTDGYRELPPDTEHGPFPVVVVVHGQASFRAAAASQLTHWASRGFIAIAADHPGLLLRDTLAGNGGCTGTGIVQDFQHTRDLQALFAQLAQPAGIFSFLEGAIDAQRVALAGHGDGARYAADNGELPGVKLVMAISDAGPIPREGAVAGGFYLSGTSDKIVAYNNVVRAYENTARGLRPTLLAGMANVGHLGFTDLCGARNADGQDAIAMARRYDICGGAAIDVADQYFWDCPLSPLAGSDNYLDQAATTALVRKLSTLALEELLLGQPRAQVWNDLAADTSWGELRQTR
jgi:hypothetical protein